MQQKEKRNMFMNSIYEYLNRNKKFSGVVSITKDNKVIFEEAYGWANIEKNIKNNTSTKFPTGSMMAKPITALSAFQLIEQGELQLSDGLEKFFPHYKGSGIDIQHLLNHTSGIRNHLMLRKKIKWDQAHEPELIEQILEKETLQFPVGKKSTYNNSGFLIMGLIIQKITGLLYHDYVKKFIFQPAGMSNSGFISDNLGDIAGNYINDKRGPIVDPSLLFACGDVVSNVEDIHRFDKALKSEIFAKQKTINLMQEPSYQGRFVTFGYSWFLKDLMGSSSISHGGNHPGGFTSHFERDLEDNLTIIVLSNNLVSYSPLSIKEFGGTFLSREIASLLFKQKLHFWQKLF
jgi:CubicO group peptidase (beta-lactamase class C family)